VGGLVVALRRDGLPSGAGRLARRHLKVQIVAPAAPVRDSGLRRIPP
jgi:hypothetical protein